MKPKHFNRQKCIKCRYHGNGCGGYNATIIGKNGHHYTQSIYCNYSGITGKTCLQKDGSDLRGTNYNKCQLYEKGKPPRMKEGDSYVS